MNEKKRSSVELFNEESHLVVHIQAIDLAMDSEESNPNLALARLAAVRRLSKIVNEIYEDLYK